MLPLELRRAITAQDLAIADAAARIRRRGPRLALGFVLSLLLAALAAALHPATGPLARELPLLRGALPIWIYSLHLAIGERELCFFLYFVALPLSLIPNLAGLVRRIQDGADLRVARVRRRRFEEELRASRKPLPIALLAAAALASVLLGPAASRADTIHLEKGGKVTGSIIDEDEDEVVLQTPTGVRRIERSLIRKIERDADVFEQFKKDFDELAGRQPWEKTADAWYKLGLWAEEKGLKVQAVDCFRQALVRDADHLGARAKLGYRRLEGAWLTEDAWWRARGFVEWEGRWIPREDFEKLQQGLVQAPDGSWYYPAPPEEEGPGKAQDPSQEDPDGDPVAARPRRADPGPRTDPIEPDGEPRPGVGRIPGPPGGGPGQGASGEAWDPELRKQRLEALNRGEGWKRSFSTKYYDFHTNGDELEARQLGRIMDRMFEEYQGIFNHREPLPEPFVITLYASQQEFMAATGNGPGVGGYYQWSSGGGARIVAFHGKFAGLSTQEVLFHEGTHQFEGMILPNNAFMRRAKTWLIEGLAVYFEPSVFENGRLTTGVIPAERLMQLKQTIRQNAHHPLEELIRMDQRQFGSMEYAQAWSLIHFFAHAYGGKNRRYFVDYFQKVKAGAGDPVELFQEVFDKPMPVIEQFWKDYVMELK